MEVKLLPAHFAHNFRCVIPGYNNDTFEIQGPQHQALINQYIPESTDEQHKYDQCNVFTGNNTYGNDSRPINASKLTCGEWVYDKTDFKSTFVTQVLHLQKVLD